jgi:hypothetical protein
VRQAKIPFLDSFGVLNPQGEVIHSYLNGEESQVCHLRPGTQTEKIQESFRHIQMACSHFRKKKKGRGAGGFLLDHSYTTNHKDRANHHLVLTI